MVQFILTRLARALLTLFIIVTFAFFVLRLSGDPASRFFDPGSTPPEVIAAFRQQWGLDQPVWVQFYKYLGAVLHGDLGNSMRENRSAVETVFDKLPATLAIMVPTLILKTILGISAGVLAALHRNSLFDRLIMSISVLGFTVPILRAGAGAGADLCGATALAALGRLCHALAYDPADRDA